MIAFGEIAGDAAQNQVANHGLEKGTPAKLAEQI
jgi:hypothetical protein